MAPSLFTTLSLASCLVAQTFAIAIPTPAGLYERRHADCAAPTPLGYVTPSPSAKVVTITSQGQPVTTFIPTALSCCEDLASCSTQYSTVSYRWYSTYIAVYPHGEPQFVSRGEQVITLPAREPPKYAVQTMTCTAPGTYEIAGISHEIVNVPTEILFVKEVERTFATCQVHDYFQWLQNLGRPQLPAGQHDTGSRFGSWWAGYTQKQAIAEPAGLPVTYFHCLEDNCTPQEQRWCVNYQPEVREVVIAATFTGWCHTSGPCTVYAFQQGFGRVSITVNVDGPGPCTRSATITTTATVTATITSTATVTNTVTDRGMTTVAPGLPNASAFRARVRFLDPNSRVARRQSNSEPYVGIDDSSLALTYERNEAVIFSIVSNRMYASATDFAFADSGDLGSRGPILVSGTFTGPSTTFSIDRSDRNNIVWQNGAFARGRAGYCLDDDNIINGLYSGTFDDGCEEVEIYAEFLNDIPSMTALPTAMPSNNTMTSASSVSTSNPSACTPINTVNHITNGGFETGAFAPWATSSVGDGVLGLVTNVAPRAGTYDVTITSARIGDAFSISQTFNTCQGRAYRGTVYAQVIPAASGPNSCAVNVQINGVTIATQGAAAAYTAVPFTFTGNAATTTLTIQSTCGTGSTPPATFHLDDVSVVDDDSA